VELKDGKRDNRPYMGVLNLTQNLLNYALQSYRNILELKEKIAEYKQVYGDLPSEIFGES
jgi:hypothetical protein